MAGTSISFDIIARDMASAKLGRVGAAAEKSSGPIGRLGKSMGSIAKTYGPLAAAAAGAFAVKVGIDSVNAASDLNETLSKSEVLFGKSAEKIADWGETAAMRLGQSKREAIDAASTFAMFGKSADLSGKHLVDFSTDMAELASDMASFSNTSPEDAITAIGAALRGESEPIRRYGVLLNEATLKARAMSMGIVEATKDTDKIRVAQIRANLAQEAYNESLKEHGKESEEARRAHASLLSAQSSLKKATEGTIPPLTNQQKVLAAQAEIIAQTSDAQGDFSRTSAGLANQQRILVAQFEDTKAELGQKLLPVAVEFTTWLNKDGIPLVKEFGRALNSEAVQPLQELGAAFDDAKTSAQPFFDLFGKDGASADIGALFDFFSMGKETLGVFSAALRGAGKALGKMGDAGRELWNRGLKPAFQFILGGVAGIAEGFESMFRAMSNVPGFGWAKKAADQMGEAALAARNISQNIRDIPREWSTNYQLRTHYSYTGGPAPKGGPIDPAGRMPGGSSGRTVSGPSSREMASVSRSAGMSPRDFADILSSGVQITMVDGDAGRRAIMSRPGVLV